MEHLQVKIIVFLPINCFLVAGSRSGAPVSGAWFAMMHLGKAGYKDLAKKIFKALNYLKKEITAIPEV